MSNLKELKIKLVAPELNKSEDGVIQQKTPKFKDRYISLIAA